VADPTGDISRLNAAVKSGQVRVAEVIENALGRIDRLDPLLNAVVARRDEDAVREARALDDALDRGQGLGPLAGVPVLVKDLEDVAGMPTTQGSRLLADVPAADRHGTPRSPCRRECARTACLSGCR
jgi:amidase